MNVLDSTASIGSSIKRYTKFITSSGLERLLLYELNKITKNLNVISGGKSHISALCTVNEIWTILLNSRICKEIWIHVRDPFVLKHQKNLFMQLNSSDWGLFIPFSSELPKPYTKVISSNSVVKNTMLIQSIVRDVIKGHCHRSVQLQGDHLPKVLEKHGYTPIPPKVMITLENNLCKVLVNASGDLSERPWHKFSSIPDRLESNAAAAISYEIFKTYNYNEIKEFTIWDPFCHNGSLLMELYSILSGTFRVI
ncbi:hypothetical protein BEWA_010000 [Theileria equi strain WA]|uniref:THUMP domain-containing protein n=1 Tax=Theileria equi strain WA TaxID=1537102 RepID=L0B2Y5_THEEQ|nr:hypothetical protein BEWA_010000 [Theileria equi strain WA]AFZ81586.1 hypothetical protein BEWA_010000 [Theileria equi strain WA]|eukprot:XP_004831252.1 hypothetical protein BEWA_010000 [Theileria equi strain WA]